LNVVTEHADLVEILVEARIISVGHAAYGQSHVGLALGDKTGILNPDVTTRLVSVVASSLPRNVASLAVGPGTADVLLAYLVGLERGIPVVSVINNDGVVTSSVSRPLNRNTWLFSLVLDEATTVDDFVSLCEPTDMCRILAVIDDYR
jgi:hypothetical protein